jgi:UDP-N-acetylenolpyruvoylglucosamine reductase
MSTSPSISALQQVFGERVQVQKNISPYLTLRTEVHAEAYLELKTEEDWITAISLCKRKNIPYLIIGGGSNLAVVSPHIPGVVLRNVYQEKKIDEERDERVLMKVSSGYSITRLVKETIDAGFAGLQYHYGLPGTVGGAVVMNSKWTHPDDYIGDHVVMATVLTENGQIVEKEASYFQFSYGYSILQEVADVLLNVTFVLEKGDREKLKEQAAAALEYRNRTQPKGKPTSGCFFKNIAPEEQERIGVPTPSAGYLIDQAGLKNAREGDFVVSDIHANFILNLGQGKPEDLQKLITRIKRTVQEAYGIVLREEVLVQ